MTDITDIAALRPSERAKLGFVTDDNTGGYYVAECEECGQIFPSQTCDGGEQIADSGDYGDCYCPHCGFIDPLECDNANLVWNVQQLKIVNLTKQLEAERQRADDAHKYGSERDAENESLMLTVGRLRVEIAELKANLANPVVLKDFRTTSIQSTRPFNLFDIIVATQGADAEAIIAAGFTVKGE
ncbi:hypothetical protein [Rahnella inusitata]|uniref:hypothetical protein n=1 Tax=Rahnella inusitata TaxID=58169 RepID=UPI0039BE1763